MDDEPRLTMGQFVYDIDAETIPLLKKELESPLRNTRIRALKIIDMLDVATQFEEELIDMMDEEDHTMQLVILDLLARIASEKSRQRIREAVHDQNSFVADTARHLIEELS